MCKKIIYLMILLGLLLVVSCDKQNITNLSETDDFLIAPSDFTIEQIAVNKCELIWKDNSQGEDGFIISRKKDDEEWVEEYTTLEENSEGFIDDILPYSTYRYKITVFVNDYYSPQIENSLTGVFPGPEDLQITQLSASSYKLTWQDISNGEEGYRISCKSDNGEWVEEYALLEADSEEFIDNNLEVSLNYYYRIVAFYQEIESSFMEINIYTTPEGFVLVPGGTFTMGDTRGGGETNELPTHQVMLSSFIISKYEVTQADYQAVMGTNPGQFFGLDKPVERVTWFNAVEYCNTRSIQEGLTPCYDISDWNCDFSADGYRLPTEAEWEYAARGGSNNPDYLYSGSDDIGSVAWYLSNSEITTYTVGTKAPNSLGIYDMTGNVWEWCNDWYGDYSSGGQTDPVGHTIGTYRVFRGGSWCYSAYGCRVSFRWSVYPTDSGSNIGFRIVRRP